MPLLLDVCLIFLESIIIHKLLRLLQVCLLEAVVYLFLLSELENIFLTNP